MEGEELLREVVSVIMVIRASQPQCTRMILKSIHKRFNVHVVLLPVKVSQSDWKHGNVRHQNYKLLFYGTE